MIKAVSCVSARNIQNWIDIVCDLGFSPHIVVNRNIVDVRKDWGKEVILPRHLSFDVPQFVEDIKGISIWNLSPSAVFNYVMDSKLGVLSFTAKIKGKPYNLTIPVEHIINIVVPNTNLNVLIEALMFASVDNTDSFKVLSASVKKPITDSPQPPSPPKVRPKLSVVKKEE